MGQRHQYSFSHVVTTAPGFEVTTDNVSTANALESTSLGRTWSGPSGRAVRLCQPTTVDYYIAFGTSDISIGSSDGVQVLGGTVEEFHPVKPSFTHIAIFATTAVTVNVSLGYGN